MNKNESQDSENQLVTEKECDKVWLDPIRKSHSGESEKIGLEMEMNAYEARTMTPLGAPGTRITPSQVLVNIHELATGSSLQIDEPTGEIIGVNLPNQSNFSLEPGGQIEFASAPFVALNDVIQNTYEGLKLLEEAVERKVIFLSHGTNPIASAKHPLVVKKRRYVLMTNYFKSAPPEIRGLDMMRHAATVQVNIDIFGKEEWEQSVYLMLCLVPLTRTLFANSSFFKNKKSHFYSERQAIWDHMDPSRSGFPFDISTCENRQKVECAYAKWARSAYVLFIENLPNDEQPKYGELTFENWLNNGFRGTRPVLSQWKTHLSTLFPHLRLRNFLEIRHIDAQSFEHLFAPIAFFSAILKSKKTRNLTIDLLQKHGINPEQLLNSSENNSSFTHLPLINLAIDIHKESGEFTAVHSLESFKRSLSERHTHTMPKTALDFVTQYATYSPGDEFIKNLKL